MKKYALFAGAIVLVLLAAVWVAGVHNSINSPGGGTQACTTEAKLCPDGSYVGRTGPNCEFAPCPSATTTPAVVSATTTLTIGESATVQGVSIKVLGLAEDSRCPVDVQCIQAGTVRVRTSINASDAMTFTLGQPQIVNKATITFVSVIPAQKHSKQTIQLSDYRFTFTLVPQRTIVPGSTPPYNSGVRGTVLLGPTCPVERNPPDPGCADKPYATKITVYRSGSSAAFVIGNSDASGAFTFSLPPGSYMLSAAGGTTLPRCNETSVSVSPNVFATTTISCDTGIR